eukprot:NODE_359_length_8799_cov_0.795172.p1 type:complete len:642 gc:universal NODE_359_length_8799_cov_0.795172:4091-6016(+)
MDRFLADCKQKNGQSYLELCAQPVINVDMHDIRDYDQDLYEKCNTQPIHVINMLQEEIFKARGAAKTDFRSDVNCPDQMKYDFEVHLINSDAKNIRILECDAKQVGKHVQVSGIITRCSQVQPKILVNVYMCNVCQYEHYQPFYSEQPTFTMPSLCQGKCKDQKLKSVIEWQPRLTKYCSFQTLKIQEQSHLVPQGHVPKTLTVHCHGSLTNTCTPGDLITCQGPLMPIHESGFMKNGLLCTLYLHAMNIQKQQTTIDIAGVEKELEDLSQSHDVYTRLASSICPEIYGNLDVKKVLLLSLVGAPDIIQNGLHIRGNVHVCLMGCPGIAKSQLLKYISNTAEKAVYTTGKGSSGVGLTAAVVRDPATKQLVLEGGALVLADTGICCLDEFDKMEDNDKTAIHEIMEQQTLSISKAGIVTTLNARTSILAAANPVYGRYNPNVPAHKNVNLPAALISRFDIVYILVDTPDLDSDIALGEYVSHVHQHGTHPDLGFTPLSAQAIREYVKKAKQFTPILSREVADHIVDIYVGLRSQERSTLRTLKKDQIQHSTPRTLVSLIRLSMALARLRFSEIVELTDVNEAVRLVQASQQAIIDPSKRQAAISDKVEHIYGMIKELYQVKKATQEDDQGNFNLLRNLGKY